MTRRFRALTYERFLALEHPCAHCAFWESAHRRPMRCGEDRDDAALLEAWFKTVRSEWGECGRVAFEEGESLGVVKYAPVRYFPQVRYFSAGPPSDDAVLLACIHIRDEARHSGLGKVLLHAALRDLAQRSEKALEAYGTTHPKAGVPVIGVNFLLQSGFRVIKPHSELPLLRLEIEALAAWTDNLEAALEALHIRIPIPKGVPTPLARAK